ncbi:DMT family transporter [Natrarchaeobius halalkaliphilus]|uniref:DMT family transporter n=1 Tax=Natrarchaeobius halalkaliphilus TaxID=1679091 RepID=A0A3N6LHZ9_9EURY|nr:DMT family transporter [Natrarchaeobius halalkaliphilus]RQG86699.1 DMT family transporter [Natrarchaeobius halalkaliphilus]
MPVTIDVFLLSILAAALWGLNPVFMKKGLERDGNAILASVVAATVSFGLFVTIATVVYGPSESYLGVSRTGAAIFLFGGVIGSSLGRLVVYAGVDRVGVSVNTAILNTRPLFAAILAVGLLGEPITGWLGLGILVIVVGVVLVSLSRGGDIRGWKWYELAFPLFAAIAYGAGNVVRRYGFTATDTDVLSAFVLNEFAALGILMGYALVRHGRKLFVVSRRTYALFAAGGLLSSLALLSLFTALSRGPVIVVDPLAGTSPLFAALFTVIFLKRVERVTRGVVIGAAVIILGVVFITLG